MWVNQQMEVQKSQADSSNAENKGSVLESDGSASPVTHHLTQFPGEEVPLCALRWVNHCPPKATGFPGPKPQSSCPLLRGAAGYSG